MVLACFIIRIRSHNQRVTLESTDFFLRGYTLLDVFTHSITKSSYQFVTQGPKDLCIMYIQCVAKKMARK